MLNKSLGVFYFHFNIFSTKTAKKEWCQFLHFWVFKNVSQIGPFHTTTIASFINNAIVIITKASQGTTFLTPI